MDIPFHFDLKQTNTLKVSGLAAYVQRPPTDRLGWVLAQGVWMPGWQPKKWAMQVQLIEITWDSFEEVQAAKEANLDFEPWDYYMVTDHGLFLTDDMVEVEQYFAIYTDRAEFARHPDQVGCPHGYANHELSCELPVHSSLKRRQLVDHLLHVREAGLVLTWEDGQRRVEGRVIRVNLTSVDIETLSSQQMTLGLGPPDALRITVTEPDGYVRAIWTPSCRQPGYQLDCLPIWEFSRQEWTYTEQATLS